VAKEKSPKFEEANSETKVSTDANKIFRARIVYKSGAVQDFSIVATSTTAFETMRKAFLGFLRDGAPLAGLYQLFPGTVVVDWRDVSSFHEWFE